MDQQLKTLYGPAGVAGLPDFTLNRGRDGPKYFLQDYRQILLADTYGGYNGRGALVQQLQSALQQLVFTAVRAF